MACATRIMNNHKARAGLAAMTHGREARETTVIAGRTGARRTP